MASDGFAFPSFSALSVRRSIMQKLTKLILTIFMLLVFASCSTVTVDEKDASSIITEGKAEADIKAITILLL